MPKEQANSAEERTRPEAESAASENGGSRISRKLAIPVVAGAAVAAVTIAVRRGGGRVKDAVASADVDELPEKASRALGVAKDRLGDLAGRVPPVADNLRDILPGGGEANGRGQSGSDGAAPLYRNAEEREAAQKEREARRAERRQRTRA
ncbi:MAG: hypothetical protein ICV64_09190 [Thermoleophilia bacterium]|nr:hypothetical protein [Thermoleophilia bacterium]